MNRNIQVLGRTSHNKGSFDSAKSNHRSDSVSKDVTLKVSRGTSDGSFKTPAYAGTHYKMHDQEGSPKIKKQRSIPRS